MRTPKLICHFLCAGLCCSCVGVSAPVAPESTPTVAMVPTATAPSPSATPQPTKAPHRIQFVAVDPDDYVEKLYSSNPDGTDLRLEPLGVTPNSPDGQEIPSPDGDWIAQTNPTGVTLTSQSSTGSRPIDVRVDSRPWQVTWASDSRHLAFVAMSQSDIETISVYIVDVPAGEFRMLEEPNALDTFDPVWSSTENQLAFVGGWKRDACGPGSFVKVLSASDLSRRDLMPGAQSVCNPSWSPVASMLAVAAQAETDVSSEIYVVDTRHWETRTVFRTSTNDCCVEFSPDGAHVAFISLANGVYKIFVGDIVTGTIWRLTDLSDDIQERSFSWTP